MPSLTIPVDTEFAEVPFGNYLLVVQAGKDDGGAVGHHLAVYPAAVLAALAPGDDYPEPVDETVPSRTWNVTPLPLPGAAGQ